MATGREYLESIISQAADMQRWSDADLDMFRSELEHCDDRMPSDPEARDQMRAEANEAARRTEAVVSYPGRTDSEIDHLLRPRSFEELGLDEADALAAEVAASPCPERHEWTGPGR